MSILDGITIPLGSRFSIHENVNVAPGVCAVCRSAGGDGRHFVDFGFQMDYYGAVFFCSECVRELCEAIGFVPSVALENSRKLSMEAVTALGKLQGEYNDFRSASATILRNCTCGLSGSTDNGIGEPTSRDEPSISSPVKKSGNGGKPDKAGSS